MFEYIVMRRSGLDDRVMDLGLLAETLLFYQKTHLLLDSASLGYFVRHLGEENFTRLLDRPDVSASFQPNVTATYTDRTAGFPLHNFAIIRRSGHRERKFRSDDDLVEVTVERAMGGPSQQARQFSRKLCKRLSFAPLPEGKSTAHPDHIMLPAAGDLKDERFVRDVVQRVIAALAPSVVLPAGWHLRAHFTGSAVAGQSQFVADTNLDFTALNEQYHQFVSPAHSSLSPEYLMTFVLGAREAAFVSSKHMAELVTDPATSAVMRLKFLDLIRKRDAQVSEVDLFQEMTLQNAGNLREAVRVRTHNQ